MASPRTATSHASPSRTTSQHAGAVPRPRHVHPLRVPAGQTAGQQIVEQGVAEALRGGDDLLGALDRLVDAIEDGGDSALFGEGWEQGWGGSARRSRETSRKVLPALLLSSSGRIAEMQ